MLTSIPTRVEPKKDYKFLNQFQLKATVSSCLQCQTQPCNSGCPCRVDIADAIHALEMEDESSVDLAALILYSKKPFGRTLWCNLS